MKNIFLTVTILFSAFAQAQVAIGKSSISVIPSTTTPNPAISLEFGNTYTISPVSNTDPRGLVLPWVTSTAAVSGVVNGTLVYNASDKKVYVKYASGWKDLSVDVTGTTVDPITSVDGLALQNSLSDLENAKVSIGTPTSTPGILVLEDSNKAMVLPKVASPHLSIINPAPGMMVYDTVKKQLAVFNGKVWTFWKP